MAVQFLIGTMALRGIFTFDRYFIDLYTNKSVVGIYSFYIGITNAMLGFCDAGVISRLYPKIVTAFLEGNHKKYKQHLKEMAVGIVLLFTSFSIGLFISIKPMLHFIGREVYFEQIKTLWILLISMGVYCLGLVPHYALYSHGADRSMVVASVLSAFVFLSAAIYLTPMYGAQGMAFSMLFGLGSLGVLKTVLYIRFKKFIKLI